MSARALTLSVLALIASLSLACAPRDASAAKPKPPPPVERVDAEHYVAPPLPKARVLLPDAFGGWVKVEVEVAATPDSRERGLMWRRELAEGTGMLFIFERDEVQSFWMKNTLIALDMLFIDGEGRIVGIVEQAQPKTLEPRTVHRPGRYVLEVPGGWVSKKGIQPGATVKFEGLSGIEVVP